MFSETFYPTPAWLADKLIEPYKLHGAIILEPSAGKGDIVDAIMRRYSNPNSYTRDSMPRVLCVEVVSELRSVLEGKGYTVVGFDFLEYYPTLSPHFVFMNPPWNRGVEHVLHAWEILSSGTIAAILPVTALDGKTQRSNILLRLIETHGSEPEHLGAAFAHAERTTRHEAVIVRLTKPAQYDSRLDFEPKNDDDLRNKAAPDFDHDKGADVALGGFIADLLQRFNLSVESYGGYKVERLRILHYAAPFLSYIRDGHTANAVEAADKVADPRDAFNTFVTLLQEAAWTKVLDHPKLQRVLTARARDMMEELRRRQGRVDFNEENLRLLLGELVARQSELYNACITDAFDTMTYHTANRAAVEGGDGWKSNHAWFVARRVVLPGYLTHGHSSFYLDYRQSRRLGDIDRALCNVTGRNFDSITTICEALEASFADKSALSKKCYSEFFKLRYFQKGTLHLYWLDETVRKDFNIAAARGRGWLPPKEV